MIKYVSYVRTERAKTSFDALPHFCLCVIDMAEQDDEFLNSDGKRAEDAYIKKFIIAADARSGEVFVNKRDDGSDAFGWQLNIKDVCETKEEAIKRLIDKKAALFKIVFSKAWKYYE